jgi:hypothetical protein
MEKAASGVRGSIILASSPRSLTALQVPAIAEASNPTRTWTTGQSSPGKSVPQECSERAIHGVAYLSSHLN